MSDHEWIGWTALDEPGISDIDGGQWARLSIRCVRCGDQRKVWRGVQRDGVPLISGCRAPAARLMPSTVGPRPDRGDMIYLGWAMAGVAAGLLVVCVMFWLLPPPDDSVWPSILGVVVSLGIASLGAWIGIQREHRAPTQTRE